MRAQATASALRITMSVSEAADLITLARDAEALGRPLSQRLADTIALLDCTQHSVRMTQARKRADRTATRDAERSRRDRQHHDTVDGLNVSAERADFVDLSRNPDWRSWQDLHVHEALGRPMPDQCEIRRDVWCVRVTQREDPDAPLVVGIDCTETADRREIRPLVERIIARRAAVSA